MSQLKTYTSPRDERFVSVDSMKSAVHLPPGALVRDQNFRNTFGIMVANGNDFITVLWSRAPWSNSQEALRLMEISWDVVK